MPMERLVQHMRTHKKQAAILTQERLKDFKEAYAECEGSSFTWEGQEVLRSYAEYLLEFMEPEEKPTHSDQWSWDDTEVTPKDPWLWYDK